MTYIQILKREQDLSPGRQCSEKINHSCGRTTSARQSRNSSMLENKEHRPLTTVKGEAGFLLDVTFRERGESPTPQKESICGCFL